MTDNDFQRAMLVEFAVRQAGARASVEMMQCICYVIRNRVRAGWHDGNWINVMEHAEDSACNEPGRKVILDPADRSFQILKRDIDDIYYGQSGFGWGEPDATKDQAEDSLETAVGTALYWAFLDRPMTEWFKANIIADKVNHKDRAQMGMMLFFT